MVRGLGTFKRYFKEFQENYIIIGGTACDIVIDAAGFSPRATQDIDIILIVEAISPDFVAQFWRFIIAGNYKRAENNESEHKYYRFKDPALADFPKQIELFSRMPDLLNSQERTHLVPIPIDEDLSSLSAILMNEDYYNYTRAHCTKLDDLHWANTEALICLKAKAHIDMIERREKGERVEEKNIKKHKGDVFRLMAILPGNANFELPESIRTDMLHFVDVVKGDLPDKAIFKEMRMGPINPETIYQQLIKNFRLGDI